jgi:hypothetical protein
MAGESLAIDIVTAAATTGAVVVALWTSQRALGAQTRNLQVEGRRQAALEIAHWLQSAETGIRAWHDPENWRVRPEMEFGPETGIRPGDVVPPSQGRMAPSVETAIAAFDSVRGSARLAFGPRHEVSSLVDEVIRAVQHVADRGVISNPDEPAEPREYVDQTFLPLAADLFEALAEATELRGAGELTPRSGVRAS